jgi:hypothetical protein
VDQCNEEECEILSSEYASRRLEGRMSCVAPTTLRAGRIVIELYDDCPKTVTNFKVMEGSFIA